MVTGVSQNVLDRLNINLSAQKQNNDRMANADYIENEIDRSTRMRNQQNDYDMQDSQYFIRKQAQLNAERQRKTTANETPNDSLIVEKQPIEELYERDVSADDVLNDIRESKLNKDHKTFDIKSNSQPQTQETHPQTLFKESNDLSLDETPSMNPTSVGIETNRYDMNNPSVFVSSPNNIRSTLPSSYNATRNRVTKYKHRIPTPEEQERLNARNEMVSQAYLQQKLQERAERRAENLQLRREQEELERLQAERDALPIIMPRQTERGTFEGSIDFLGDGESLGVRTGNYDFVFGEDMYENTLLVNPSYIDYGLEGGYASGYSSFDFFNPELSTEIEDINGTQYGINYDSLIYGGISAESYPIDDIYSQGGEMNMCGTKKTAKRSVKRTVKRKPTVRKTTTRKRK